MNATRRHVTLNLQINHNPSIVSTAFYFRWAFIFKPQIKQSKSDRLNYSSYSNSSWTSTFGLWSGHVAKKSTQRRSISRAAWMVQNLGQVRKHTRYQIGLHLNASRKKHLWRYVKRFVSGYQSIDQAEYVEHDQPYNTIPSTKTTVLQADDNVKRLRQFAFRQDFTRVSKLTAVCRPRSSSVTKQADQCSKQQYA